MQGDSCTRPSLAPLVVPALGTPAMTYDQLVEKAAYLIYLSGEKDMGSAYVLGMCQLIAYAFPKDEFTCSTPVFEDRFAAVQKALRSEINKIPSPRPI